MDMFPGYERPTRSNVSDPITTETVTSGAGKAGPGTTVTHPPPKNVVETTTPFLTVLPFWLLSSQVSVKHSHRSKIYHWPQLGLTGRLTPTLV